jgi:HEAT repeat protein
MVFNASGRLRRPDPALSGRLLSYWLSQLERPASERDPDTRAALASRPDLTLAALCERLTARDHPVRLALLHLARTYPSMGLRVVSADAARQGAAEVLLSSVDDQDMGRAPAEVPIARVLVEGLTVARHPEAVSAVRECLVHAGRPAVPALMTIARHRRTEVRRRTLETLLGVLDRTSLRRSEAQLVRSVIAPLLEDADPEIARMTTAVIARLPKGADVIVPVLVRNLQRHRSASVRAASAVALGAIGRRADLSVAALDGALSDSDEPTRVAAAGALGRFAADASPAVPRLVRMARDGRVRVASAAIRALGKVGLAARDAAPVLLANLDSREPGLRSASVIALGRLGGEPDEVVPQLARALFDEDAYVRYNAARALTAYGPQAYPALPSLIKALSDPAESVRVCAAEALGAIGAAAMPAAEALRAARNNNQSVMTRPVVAALERIHAEPGH